MRYRMDNLKDLSDKAKRLSILLMSGWNSGTARYANEFSSELDNVFQEYGYGFNASSDRC